MAGKPAAGDLGLEFVEYEVTGAGDFIDVEGFLQREPASRLPIVDRTDRILHAERRRSVDRDPGRGNAGGASVVEVFVRAHDPGKTRVEIREIGARDRVTLQAILNANKAEKASPSFFKCKREYSETIVSYFVNEKGLTKSKFDMNTQ